MRLCKHCGGDSPKKSIGQFYFCDDQCIEDRVFWQANEIARLTIALKSLILNCRELIGGHFNAVIEQA